MADIERAIGRLEAEAESSRNQRKLIFEKLDKLLEQTAVLPAMNQHIADHCEELKTINNLVQRGKGAWWLAGLLWVVVPVMCAAGAWGFSLYKADQDARIRQIENAMPRSLYGAPR